MWARAAGLCKMSSGLTISEVSSSGRLQDVLDHVTPIFLRDEPLSRCFPPCRTGRRERDFRWYAEQELRSGYSVMALDDGKVVGACLCKPLHRRQLIADRPAATPADGEHPGEDEEEDPLNKSVVQMLTHVHRKLDLFSRFGVDTLLDVALLSVEGTHGGRGLATQMVLASMSLAADQGLRLAKADCTGPRSARVCHKAGMATVFSLPYSEYLVDGRPVFQAAGGALTVVAAELPCPPAPRH